MRFAFLMVVVAACGPAQYMYAPASSTAPATARGDDCRFDLLTTPPSRAYEELGTLDLYSGGATGAPQDIEEFRRTIGIQVCRAGGEAVVALANGHGRYIKGTVLRYVQPLPAATPAAATP